MKSGPSSPSHYNQLVLVLLLVATLATSDAFSIPSIHRGVAPLLVKGRSSSRGATDADGVSVPSTTADLKADLLERIQTFVSLSYDAVQIPNMSERI